MIHANLSLIGLVAIAILSACSHAPVEYLATQTDRESTALVVGPEVKDAEVFTELASWVGSRGSSPNLFTQNFKRCVYGDSNAAASTDCDSSVGQKCIFLSDEERSVLRMRSDVTRVQICAEKIKDADSVLIQLYWPSQPTLATTQDFRRLRTALETKFGKDKVRSTELSRVQ